MKNVEAVQRGIFTFRENVVQDMPLLPLPKVHITTGEKPSIKIVGNSEVVSHKKYIIIIQKCEC